MGKITHLYIPKMGTITSGHIMCVKKKIFLIIFNYLRSSYNVFDMLVFYLYAPCKAIIWKYCLSDNGHYYRRVSSK